MNAKEKERIGRLENRLRWLERRYLQSNQDLRLDKAEASALRWAIDFIITADRKLDGFTVMNLDNRSHTQQLLTLQYGEKVDLIFLNNEKKILLKKIPNQHVENKFIWRFPIQTVVFDEHIIQSLKEKILASGCDAKILTKIGDRYKYITQGTQLTPVFLVTDFTLLPNFEDSSNEATPSEWFNEEQIDQMVRTNKILDTHTLAIWALYKLHSSK